MSFVMTDSGVLTPSILEQNVVSFETDIALLDYICNTIERDAVLVVMNRHQMKNAVKRMLLVYSLLSKLPNPRPTPAILCVMRSGLLLLQRMMPLNEHDNHWQQRLRRSFACRHWFAALRERQGAVWHLHSSSSWADEDRRAVEMDEVENATLLMQLVQQGRVVLPDLVDGSSVDALVHSYRGVEQAYWKLPFERLRHRATHDHMPVPHSTITQDDHNTALRFTIHRDYVYEDRRVVVKSLDSDHLDPETMTYFVQDSVARMKWCHPHIVEYFGAFTEKFLTVEQECKAWESAQHSSHRTYPVVSLPGMSAEESARTVMEKNIPRLSLGLVMEDMLRGTTSSSPTSGPLHGFESLHEVLFVEHRRLTIDACISITLQVADALEYILLDKANLPAEVVRAWISISPSNLFIAKNAGGAAASARFVGSDEPITGEDVLVASTDIQVDEIVFSRESIEASPVPSPTKSALTSAHRTTMSSQASDVNPLSPPPPPCETLAVKGSPFVVKYSPPIYVHDGLCSRWYPHPCAKSPSCYALAQLFLALLTNLPPYRYLRTQHDLLRAIFDDQDTLSDDAMVHVKVNRHTGYSIPAGLPKALKALCQGALMLKDNKSKAMTVAQFRDALMDARDCLGQLVHMPLHTTGVESRPTSYPSEMDDHAHRKDTIQSWGDYGDVE